MKLTNQNKGNKNILNNTVQQNKSYQTKKILSGSYTEVNPKFSFYFVCGININCSAPMLFSFVYFRRKTQTDCMQPIVCFWSVNNCFVIFISIIYIIKYSWLKHSCFFDKPSEALKPPILCPRIQRGYKIS